MTLSFRNASPPSDLRLVTRASTREIVAVFTQDEARLEVVVIFGKMSSQVLICQLQVVVALPASFPLRVPSSTGAKGFKHMLFCNEFFGRILDFDSLTML